MNKIKQFGLAVLAITGLAWTGSAEVYDDFSSGDLSKWIFESGDPDRTDPQVVNHALQWTAADNAASLSRITEYLTSTQRVVDLSASGSVSLQWLVADIASRTNADSFDAIRFGWEDESGNTLYLRYDWKGDNESFNSAFQIVYNGEKIGDIGWNRGYWLEAGDAFRMDFIPDSGTIEVYRIRSGVETLVISRTDTSMGGLGGNIWIQLALGDGGEGSSITLDDIAVESTPRTYTSKVYDDFSSGDIAKWTFITNSPARTDPYVDNHALVWEQIDGQARYEEFLFSTQSVVNLSTAPVTLQLAIADVVPNSGVTTFDIFSFGWEDETGDRVRIRYNWRELADEQTGSALQLFWNGAVADGAYTVWDGGLAFTNGDIVKLEYIPVTRTVNCHRTRGGADDTLFSFVVTNAVDLTGDLKIFMSRSDSGNGSSITLDDITVISESIPVGMIGMERTGSNVVINWEGQRFDTYAVQRRLDLTAGAWSNIIDGISGTGSTLYVTNTESEVQAFYRIVKE
jgi:hypothetical protein